MNSSQLSALSSQESQKHTLLRWVKFNAVGGIGIVVQLAALAVFRSWLKVDYLLATGLAVEIAVLHNFLWHERFTWADRPAARRVQSLLRLAKFNASNGAVSIIGNLVLMRLLVGELRFNYFASNLVAIVICSLVNFVVGDRFVFAAEANPTTNSPGSCRTALGLDGRGRPSLRDHSVKLKYACCQDRTSGHRCPARHSE
jgi:putative flippase GtrA